MVVYLVSTRSKRVHFEGDVLQNWVRALRGESDHVELVFVDAAHTNELLAFWVTRRTRYVVYDVRDYTRMKAEHDLVWYALDKLDLRAELDLRRACEEMADEHRFAFGDELFAASALPVRRLPAVLVQAVAWIAEPAAAAAVGFVASPATGPTTTIPVICSSACGRALQRANLLPGKDATMIERLTPNDLVILAIRELGARAAPEPEPRPTRAPWNVCAPRKTVRSPYWNAAI